MAMPYDLEAEQAVLGSCLLSSDAFLKAIDECSERDFYVANHRHIFTAMQDIHLQKADLDVISLISALKSKGVFDEIGIRYIGDLSEYPSSANLPTYIKALKDRAMRRQAIEAAFNLSEAAKDESEDIEQTILSTQKIMADISSHKPTELTSLSKAVCSAFKQIERAYSDDRHCVGVSTGLDEIDNILHGLQGGKLYILAARPGMGKSALAKGIAESVAKEGTVLFCSMEMSAEEIAKRHLSGMARVNMSAVQSGRVGDKWGQLTTAAGRLSDLPIWLNDRGVQTDASIIRDARKVKRDKGLSLVVIDYIQLLRPSVKCNSREEQVATMSRNLKALAMELNVPVLALAQLNRECEREKRKPRLSDLRESGGIEQDADVIIFLHRENQYNHTIPPEQAEAIIAKQRDGQTGIIDLVYKGEYTTFYSKEGRYD